VLSLERLKIGVYLPAPLKVVKADAVEKSGRKRVSGKIIFTSQEISSLPMFSSIQQ